MTALRRAWEMWKRFGRKVGDFQARALLTIFYFVIMAPFGLAVRGADPLGLRRPSDAGWRTRPAPPTGDPVARAQQQY